MVKGGIIIIDDCGWDALPGCKQAVEDFLKDIPLVMNTIKNNN